MLSATGRALISPRTESRTTHLLTTPHSQHAPLNSSVSMSWHLSLVTSTALGSYCRILIHQSLKWPLNNANNTTYPFYDFNFYPSGTIHPLPGVEHFLLLSFCSELSVLRPMGLGLGLMCNNGRAPRDLADFGGHDHRGPTSLYINFPSLRHVLGISVRVRSLKIAPQ